MNQISNKFDPGSVHLWEIKLGEYFPQIEKMAQVLSVEETHKADAFHLAADRRNYIVSHGALRLILAEYTDQKPQSLHFNVSKFGKPFLENSPLKFNLSHSAEYALIGVAAKREIGIDIEFIRENVNYEELAAQFFSTNEPQFLDSQPEKYRRREFFRIWSRKEAFIKAKGCGLSMDLRSFNVCKSEIGESNSFIINTTDAAGSNWSGRDLNFAEKYAAAVVLEGENFEMIVKDFNSLLMINL